MNRLVRTIVCGSLLGCSFTNPLVDAAAPIEANVAGLQDQLESGLKVRRQAERDFITKVVTMVGNDQLPLALVKSTFQWTRKNPDPRAKQYPFFYFQRALRERAKKLGIDV